MTRHAAFLRAINVGGRRVTNEELRSCFEGIGLRDVATFRASGNVVFGAQRGDRPDQLAERIEAGLAQSLGYEVPAFVRTAAEVTAIAGREPFAAELVAASSGKLQVALLLAKPTAAARQKLLALASDEDRLAIEGRELYWLPSGGIMESPLDMSAIATVLGSMTMRTKNTIEQIAAKYFSDGRLV